MVNQKSLVSLSILLIICLNMKSIYLQKTNEPDYEEFKRKISTRQRTRIPFRILYTTTSAYSDEEYETTEEGNTKTTPATTTTATTYRFNDENNFIYSRPPPYEEFSEYSLLKNSINTLTERIRNVERSLEIVAKRVDFNDGKSKSF